MIIDSGNNSLQTNVPSNGANYTIAATAQAFQILSSAIYEHKIAAVVRELCTNAYDSHIQAGKADQPFKVTLPNDIHPYFEVEDFGVGLSMDDATNIYTVYFASTKNTDNTVAGGLGLGSKTPFAYTKQFTVRIRKDGVENTAMIYMDASGCPRMDVISTMQTSEPNGVKVTVPVSPSDARTFHTEAAFYLSFYPVKPEINIDLNLTYPAVGKELEDNGIAYCKRATTSWTSLSRGNFYVVMGPVAYGIDIMSLISDRLDREILQSSINNQGAMFVKFDIGDVAVAASRESLSLDKKTEEFVKDKFTQQVREFRKNLFEAANVPGIHITEMYDRFVEKYNSGAFISMGMAAGNTLSSIQRGVHIPRLGVVRSKWGREREEYLRKRVSILDVHTKCSTEIRILELDMNTATHPLKKVSADVRKDFVYFGTLTESRIKRIEAIFNKKVVVTKYSKVYADILEERRKNRKTGGPRTKYANSSIIASGFIATIDENGEFRSQTFRNLRRDIDEDTFWYDGDNSMSINVREAGEFIDDALKFYMETEEIARIVLVRKTAQNEKRLEKFNVEDFEVVLKSFTEEHKEEIADAYRRGTKGLLNVAPALGLLADTSEELLDAEMMADYTDIMSMQLNGPVLKAHHITRFFYAAYVLVQKHSDKMAAINNFIRHDAETIFREHYQLLSDAFEYRGWPAKDTEEYRLAIELIKTMKEFKTKKESEQE